MEIISESGQLIDAHTFFSTTKGRGVVQLLCLSIVPLSDVKEEHDRKYLRRTDADNEDEKENPGKSIDLVTVSITQMFRLHGQFLNCWMSARLEKKRPMSEVAFVWILSKVESRSLKSGLGPQVPRK
jgi:hypothetical protein